MELFVFGSGSVQFFIHDDAGEFLLAAGGHDDGFSLANSEAFVDDDCQDNRLKLSEGFFEGIIPGECEVVGIASVVRFEFACESLQTAVEPVADEIRHCR